MKTPLRLMALATLLALGACTGEELTRTFGLTRDAPDEFQVTTRAPLSMPPNFALRPPQPGAGRPQELSDRQQAEAALVPSAVNQPAGAASLSPGEQSLVAAAGPPPPPDIRRQVNSTATADNSGGSFADTIMFWRKPTPSGVVVDPAREAQRLRQNAALGQPQTTGDTPIIQRRQGGLLGNLF